jgi:hypothetical protein
VLARKWYNNAISDSQQDLTQSYLFPDQKAIVDKAQCHRLRCNDTEATTLGRLNVTEIKQVVAASIVDTKGNCVSALWCDNSNVLHPTAYQHIRVRTKTSCSHSFVYYRVRLYTLLTTYDYLNPLQQAVVVGGAHVELQESEFIQLYALHEQLPMLGIAQYDITYLSAHLQPIGHLREVIATCADVLTSQVSRHQYTVTQYITLMCICITCVVLLYILTANSSIRTNSSISTTQYWKPVRIRIAIEHVTLCTII